MNAIQTLQNKGFKAHEKEFIIHARSEHKYGVYHPFSEWWKCGNERGFGLNKFIDELCKH